MATKLSPYRCIWFIFLFLLVACGQKTVNPPTATPTHAPTSLPLPTIDFTAVFASPTPAGPTPIVNQQVVNAWQTQIALATPIRTPVTPVQVEKFPRVTIKEDGNLYFQKNAGQSVKLTNSGNDRDPILSDDGQKIVFSRGEAYDNLHFSNSDGSQEEAILASETPLLIGKGEITSPTFIPGTHILLFNTYLCGSRKGLYDGPECAAGVYSLNADSGELEKIIDNLSGGAWRERNFEISPSGKYVSVAGSGHIDIYAFSSGHFTIEYPNVITYYITHPDEYLPRQYWFPDSNGLIVVLAADSESNDPSTVPALYVAFRYTIKDKQAIQVPLDKFITWDSGQDDWSISPDRNWILFSGNETGYRGDYSFHYLGNLIDGHTIAYQEIGLPLDYCEWSPDSKHFAFRSTTPGFIGSVNSETFVLVDGSFGTWIDSTHYYYAVIGETVDTIPVYVGEISND